MVAGVTPRLLASSPARRGSSLNSSTTRTRSASASARITSVVGREGNTMARMPSTTTSDLCATRDQVLAHRAQLRQMASEEGLSRLRVDVAGTVIAHTNAPGYGPLRRFATAASGLVGAWVNVVTDDVPAAEVSASAL